MDNQQTILVIFGITGDLSRRKLLPALRNIIHEGLLPPTKIIGISRRDVDVTALLDEALGSSDDAARQTLQAMLSVFTMDLAHGEDYGRLATHIAQAEQAMGGQSQVLFYLSVPPQASLPIIEQLGTAGLNDPAVKLLLEKPFGVDLASAQETIDRTARSFSEQQLYRIDHYLAKEMAQNIVTFRSCNALFRMLWHREAIEKIEIIASEAIGIEGRTAFYEQTGALRDFLQNHLFQLMALTIMDIPAGLEMSDVPALRLKALQSLAPIHPDTFDQQVRRGQYQGYAEEVANPGTPTETFAAVTLYSNDPTWKDVPIVLATGKNLATQSTEIRVHFRKAHTAETNRLVMHIQPQEGIEVDLWAKKPGYEKEYEAVNLHFDYKQGGRSIDAYERVLLDAIKSDKSLFTGAAEVLASWELLAPVQQHWAMYTDDMQYYKPGTRIEEMLYD